MNYQIPQTGDQPVAACGVYCYGRGLRTGGETMRSICLGLAILIGSVFGANAQIIGAAQIGGEGGGAFDDPCQPDDVMIGFNWNSGKSLITFAAVCQAQNNGVLAGPVHGLRTWGKDRPPSGNDFHGTGAERCPTGSAIYEMEVFVNKFNEIDRVQAICLPLLPNTGSAASLRTSTQGGEAVRDGVSSCSPNMLAVGIAGRSGALVDKLGLKFSTFPWHVVANPPSPPPPSTPHFVKVIADVQIFPQCAPGAGIQPKGDLAANTEQVMLVKVGAPPNCVNWYQFSWPNNPAGDNWVYSAPPNTPGDYTSLDASTLAAAVGGH